MLSTASAVRRQWQITALLPKPDVYEGLQTRLRRTGTRFTGRKLVVGLE